MVKMEIKPFSEKQYEVLTWWCNESKSSDKTAIICDGAVRSGKTFCMSLSFVFWMFYRFNNSSFAICGKTIRSARRNIITPMTETLRRLGFTVDEKLSQNLLVLTYRGRVNRIYLFGGKDEGSAAFIQGMTLSGVLFDEVALMPRSFVEQALARCSVEGSRYWFNCNPEYPAHWFYRNWIKHADSKNALYLHFTMRDNPSLSESTIKRYENLYTGNFYERFILGKWVAVSGAVYPFMKDSSFVKVPEKPFEKYAVSIDYGTVNPASFGLWALKNEVWYRVDEVYFDSRREGFQRTDEEHYNALVELIGDRKIGKITVDPSAASFIETIRRHGKYEVTPAVNDVINGIRLTSTALKDGRIKICDNCPDSIREFSLYRWNENGMDTPIKENDHAMDDIRYFVSTILDSGDDFMVIAAKR
ncbi:MAG: PBSX family phage terminase large subunit [Ruminococcus sp.]|nr:PBSX family phage terminase large subunit [Ruminococcus sp.]